MTMDWILLRFYFLSGWFMFSTCLRQYHLIPELKTWTEAQSYCRNNYADLATIQTSEEMNQFLNFSFPNNYMWTDQYNFIPQHNLVWTGLYSNINWTWSDGYTQSGAYWTNRVYLISFFNQHQCLSIDQSGRWCSDNCSKEYTFICYNGTQQKPQYVFVNKSMSWSRAQSYCRENFTDLVTVRDYTDNNKIKKLVPSTNLTWIGLNAYFDNLIESDIKRLIVIKTYVNFNFTKAWGFVYNFPISGIFIVFPHTYRWPFFCYGSQRGVRRQIVNMKLSSSVDPNDAVVKANVLNMLQDRLQEKGVTGVTLKWREQPDGKVFHKEEKTNVTSDGC